MFGLTVTGAAGAGATGAGAAGAGAAGAGAAGAGAAGVAGAIAVFLLRSHEGHALTLAVVRPTSSVNKTTKKDLFVTVFILCPPCLRLIKFNF